MIFKAFNVMMAFLFLLSASVQLNDPDPYVWIALYLLAAAFSIGYGFRRLSSAWPIVFAIVAFLWALTLVPAFWGRASLAEVFGRMDMKTEVVEVAREFGGLMIVCAWMLVLGLRKMKSD